MKKKRTPGKVLLIAILTVLLIGAAAVIPQFIPTDYAKFVVRHEDLLVESASYSALPSSLKRAGITYAYPLDEGGIIFYLDKPILEGHWALVYQPGGEYIFHFPEAEWRPAHPQDANALRWEGGYMGGQGYVNITRLSERFFLEEAYLPT